MTDSQNTSAGAGSATVPEAGERGPDPTLRRVLWRTPFLRAACLGLFISGIGVSSTMPQLTLYLTQDLHLPVALAGLYYLVNLMAPVAGFIIGTLSERIGNRLLLYRLCAAVGATGWILMAVATRPWMPFLIGALVLSFGGGAMGQLFAATRDHLSRHPTPVNSRVIAAIRMCFSAGRIIGPVLGSWFGAAFGLRPLLLATAVCVIGQTLPLGLRRVERLVPTPAPTSSPGPERAGVPPASARATRRALLPLLTFLGCCLLVMNGDTMKFAYLPLYMNNQLHLSDTLRGTVIAIQPFLELGLMPIAARLADRFTPIRVIAGAAMLGVAAHVSYATSSHVAGLFLGQVFMSGLWAAVAGLGITVAQQLYPTKIGLAS